MGLLLNHRLFAAAAAAALVAAVWPATPALTQLTPPKIEKKAPAPGSALPKSPADRERTLSDLYALLATAENETAAKAFAEGIERVWNYSGSPTIDLLLGRATQAVSQKNYHSALRFLDNVVEQAPDFTEGWNRRAYVYFLQNNYESAVGDLRRALALEPNHFKALEGLAQIWREHGNKRGALSVFKQLLEVHPNLSGAKQAVEELTREVEGQGI